MKVTTLAVHKVPMEPEAARKSAHPSRSSTKSSSQRAELAQQRLRNRHVQHASDSLAAPIDGRQVHRAQLLATFMNLHLPTPRRGTPRSHVAFLEELPTLSLNIPLLQTAVDTICIAEMAIRYDDDKCRREAQACYTKALPMLAKELSGQESTERMPKDHGLAVIMILALCELYEPIIKPKPDGPGWLSHIMGAEQYVEQYHSAIDSEYGELLFHNLQHTSLFGGIIKRKAPIFAQPYWQRITRRLAQTDAFVALYGIGVELPRLLERADALSTHQNPSKAVRQLFRDLKAARTELNAWLKQFYPQKTEAAFEITGVEEFVEFSSACADKSFGTAYKFSCAQICSQHQVYWILCLILDFTLMDTHRKYSQPVEPLPLHVLCGSALEEVERDAYEAAVNYCCTIPYSFQPETGSIGRIGTFLIRTLQSFFEQRGCEKEVQWCLSVRRAQECGGEESISAAEQRQPSQTSVSTILPSTGPSSSDTSSPLEHEYPKDLDFGESDIPRHRSTVVSSATGTDSHDAYDVESQPLGKRTPLRPRLAWKTGGIPRVALVLVSPASSVANNQELVLPRLAPELLQVRPAR